MSYVRDCAISVYASINCCDKYYDNMLKSGWEGHLTDNLIKQSVELLIHYNKSRLMHTHAVIFSPGHNIYSDYCRRSVELGKKIIEGIATTPVTELFIVSVSKFSRDFGSLELRHRASVDPESYGPRPRTITHSLGKVRAHTLLKTIGGTPVGFL